jgi:hypothetical protein
MAFNTEQLETLVYPFAGNDPETDIMLFFTDNKNEPRSINVRRCIETDEEFTGNPFGYSGQELNDFITACPRVPEQPIQFEFQTVTDENAVEFESSFKNSDGLIFAYQNVYKNGYVSSLSSFSKVAYPPSIATLGNRTPEEVSISNTMFLTIPKQNNEVRSIRILYKEGDGGVWKLIDQVGANEDLNNVNYTFIGDEETAGVYTFYKERIYPVIPLSESSKNFDKLPAIAQSQAVSGNRLMYGNYQEGFDQVPTSSNATVVYKDRLQDLKIFDIDCKSIIFRGKMAAFTVDTSGLPETISPGLYQVNMKFKPTRNIHVYTEAGSYLGSQHRTVNEVTSFDDEFTGPPLALSVGTTFEFIEGDRVKLTSGVFPVTPTQPTSVKSLRLFKEGGIHGVGFATWNDVVNGPKNVRLGSSPAAPLILGVKEIPISFTFNVQDSITNSDVSDIIDILISSTGPNIYYAQTQSVNVSNLLLSQFNVELINTSSEGSGVIKPLVELDLGLSNEQEFDQTSSFAELVCVVDPFDTGQNAGGCGGFFIVNKADIKFRMMKVPTINPSSQQTVDNNVGFFNSYNWNESVTQTGTKKGYYFEVESINADYDNSFFSCFPKPAMGRGEVGSDGERVSFKPDTPWRIFDNEGATESGSQRNIFWPYVRGSKLSSFNGTRAYVADSYSEGAFYAMPDGMDSSIEDEFGNNETREDAVPYRIGSWLVLNSDGVNSNLFDDWYGARIDFTACPQGTSFSAMPSETVDNLNIRSYGSSNIMASFLARKYISFNNGLGISSSENLSKTWRGYITSFNYNYDQSNYLCVVDGDCGPGGQMSTSNPFSDSTLDINGDLENIVTPAFNLGDVLTGTVGGAVGAYTDGQFGSFPPEGIDESPTGSVPVHNRFGSVWNTTLLGLVTNMPYVDFTSFYLSVSSAEDTASLSPVKEGAFDALSFNNITVDSNFSTLADTELSFKTRASHDFGVVYYDKRGRRSTVNKLDSVYVPGYSDQERPGEPKGATSIRLKLNHKAPEWADSYKIFYSNRNESKRFIQYVAGDAFIEKNADSGKNKIYVSLNYLQGNRMSYSSSYGARDRDTDEPTLYRYSKGDKLRVISYYKNDTEREFLDPSYEFTILGVETLNDLLEDHPLYSDGAISGINEDVEKLKRNGQFVVLTDNSNASGFTALDIASNASNWAKRCVFEIVSPLKESNDETQPYFETNYGGKVVFSSSLSQEFGESIYIHEQPPLGHLIEEGDVFFRSVPLNTREYVNNEFVDLIAVDEEGNDNSQSRFLPYYLETESLTDLYRTVAKGYGKPNFIDKDAFRKRMEASVIFSDKTESSQFRLRHTSFSDQEQNSFNLPEKHGDLNYIAGEDEYITTLQENKAAIIPVDRSITSTSQGVESVNLSDKVLNSTKFYFGEGGPAGNPESVVEIDGYIYFADKHNKRISRLDPGGQTVENISNLGMEEYFRRQFNRLLNSSNTLDKSDLRIVGGFDPMENEFIVSFLRPEDINTEVQEGLSINAPLSSSLADLEISSEEPFVNTTSFDHSGGKAWKTRYSFNSSSYSHVNNNLISFKNNQVWDHGKNDNRNNFHGSNYMSMVKSVSVGGNGSMTKVYKSLGLESYYDWPAIIKTNTETATIPTFTNYEGTRYASMPRSKSLSTSNVKTVGVVESFTMVGYVEDLELNQIINEIDIKFASPVSTSLVLGDGVSVTALFNNDVQLSVNQFLETITPVEKIDDYVVRYLLSGPGFPDVVLNNVLQNIVQAGATIIHVGNSATHGDSLRDKYATVMLLNNSQEEAELYSVNLEVSGSKLDTSS